MVQPQFSEGSFMRLRLHTNRTMKRQTAPISIRNLPSVRAEIPLSRSKREKFPLTPSKIAAVAIIT